MSKCEFCHEDADGFVRPLDKNAHAFIKYPNKLVLKFGKDWRECVINYCPICGRGLSDIGKYERELAKKYMFFHGE